MVDGKLLIEKLLKYAEKFLYLNKRDEIYFRNILLREFNLDDVYGKDIDLSYIDELDVPDSLVQEVELYAKENNLIALGEENLFSTYIFGILCPLPSEVNRKFCEIKKTFGIEKACEFFYGLSVKSNYVQKTAISKNIKWTFNDKNNYLEITINLSKPEKDNKQIAKLLTAPKNLNYPKCLLCKENEGYKGSATHPARENIRTISLTLGNEPWFVQYSPYAYFNEHMIAVSENHTPMHIKSDTIDKLIDFVNYFPNYIIGSNAALPIIGGSILNHEHFQGGGHLMPMHKSKIRTKYFCQNYKNVKVGIVDWYNSVIRLESDNVEEIKRFAKDIVSSWEKYTDKGCGIFAETENTRHNSLAPVCRKDGINYIFDLILRNNITNKEFPDGVFHAHPEFHNIKKEGIGLIEAMGLYILPGRLKKQFAMIAEILCGKQKYIEKEIFCEKNYLYVHRNMIKEMVNEGLSLTIMDAEKRITEKVNNVCKNILENTAVFKNDINGQKGFENFLATVNTFKIN